MNRKIKLAPKIPLPPPRAVLDFAFINSFKHPEYVIHPHGCPFDYLFAMMPKNPV